MVGQFHAYVSGISYSTIGGGCSLSVVGELLSEVGWERGCGLDWFEAQVFVDLPEGKTRPEPANSPWVARFVETPSRLPLFRWERQKRKLSMSYATRIASTREIYATANYARPLVLAAIDELAGLLEAHRATLMKKPGLDGDRFIRTVRELREVVPPTDAEIRAFSDEHRTRWLAREALRPWSERLEIDWKAFHPSARSLLDDELFWSNEDEFSPHGNDTGHDLFADFRRWRRSNSGVRPLNLLALEMRRWGFDTGDQQSETAISTYDQAVVALAFGLIKLEGTCDAETRDAALRALDRQQDPVVAQRFGWSPSPPDAETAYAKARAVLARMPLQENDHVG